MTPFADARDLPFGAHPVIVPRRAEILELDDPLDYLPPGPKTVVAPLVEPRQHGPSDTELVVRGLVRGQRRADVGIILCRDACSLQEQENRLLALAQERNGIHKLFEQVWWVVKGGVECRSRFDLAGV